MTYPVPIERQDIYKQFLLPAVITPKKHKTIETTDITRQAGGQRTRVSALPRWLVQEYAENLLITPIKMGPKGSAKQIYLGIRNNESDSGDLHSFMVQAREFK